MTQESKTIIYVAYSRNTQYDILFLFQFQRANIIFLRLYFWNKNS